MFNFFSWSAKFITASNLLVISKAMNHMKKILSTVLTVSMASIYQFKGVSVGKRLNQKKAEKKRSLDMLT